MLFAANFPYFSIENKIQVFPKPNSGRTTTKNFFETTTTIPVEICGEFAICKKS